MKILYISHQKEQSGYGRSCRDYLQALKHTGLEIASFPIKLGKVGNFQDETEKNSIYNSDIVLYHTLPHHLSYSSSFTKNIAVSLRENIIGPKNLWTQYLSLMDEVWLPNEFIGTNLKSTVKIPHPINTSIYNKDYPKLNIQESTGTYKFYTICEASKRKNLSGLLLAYMLAFSSNDPVSLIIKVSKAGKNPQQIKEEIENLIQKTAIGMRISKNKYPKIFIVSDHWTDEQIYGFHQYCDCFVTTSYAEALCYPMIDAAGFNKKVISSYNFASSYYSKFLDINLVEDFNITNCYGEMDAFDGEYTFNDFWFETDIQSFALEMKSVYKNKDKNIVNNMSPLSYESVAAKMIERFV